jgi:hypothetical protein
MAIYYRTWSVSDGWSTPTAVVKSPVGILAREPLVYLDPSDQLHLVFFGGNEAKGGVYYARAAAIDAADPDAWSWPIEIESGARWAVLGGTPDGTLFVLYTGKRPEGYGLFETHSRDAGETWSEARAVQAPAESEGLMPHGTRFTVDAAGRIHAVWGLVDGRGIHQRINYARLDPEQRAWTEPVALARREGDDYQAAWPSIIEYANELILVYMDSMPATRWMRRSRDGGLTWSDPERPFPHIGEYVFAELLLDGSGGLHIVLGNRTGECCHGMWHAVWTGDGWGELAPIVTGPRTPEFDPSAPSAVISQGNVILATWWTDTGGRGPRNGAWYSYARLDAKELPTVALRRGAPATRSIVGLAAAVSMLTLAALWWRRRHRRGVGAQ